MDRLKVRTLRELIAMTPPAILYLVQSNLLAQGGNMFIYGKQETLKSWIALDLGFAVSTGAKWLGIYETAKAPVLLLQTEQTEFMYRERVVEFIRHLNGSKPMDSLLFCTDLSISLDNPFGLGLLEAAIIEHKPALVIIDNLYHTVEKLSAEENAQRFIKGIGGLQQKYNCSFCITTHPRKAQREELTEMSEEDIENLFGSAKFLWWADTVVRTGWADREAELLNLTFQKAKNAKYPVPGVQLQFHRNPVRLALH